MTLSLRSVRMYAPAASAVAILSIVAACSSNSSPTSTQVTPTSPTSPTAPTTPAAPTVTSVTVNGTTSFTAKGATAQLTAVANLSNGTTEDRTSAATWQSDNAGVASVSSGGVVTAQATGDATITASIGEVRGTRGVNVRIPNRAPDPAAGQRVPLPDVQAFIAQANAARPELLAQSCNRGLKYVTNQWLDYIVDRLRTLDTRWGYNGKPNRSAADNSGVPVVAAGDEIAYHFGAGSDEGSPDVYLIDILIGHCGTPVLGYRIFTGEEPGRWTGAGRF
jgi:hypothetical protein